MTEPIKESTTDTINKPVKETYAVGDRVELKLDGVPDDITRTDNGGVRVELRMLTPDGREHRLAPNLVTSAGQRLVAYVPSKPGVHSYEWRIERRHANGVEIIGTHTGEFLARAAAAPSEGLQLVQEHPRRSGAVTKLWPQCLLPGRGQLAEGGVPWFGLVHDPDGFGATRCGGFA